MHLESPRGWVLRGRSVIFWEVLKHDSFLLTVFGFPPCGSTSPFSKPWEKPENPGKPDSPSDPDDPGDSDKPGDPDDSDNPVTPDKPEKPEDTDDPSNPNKPENTVKPNMPSNPEESTKPEQNVQTGDTNLTNEIIIGSISLIVLIGLWIDNKRRKKL